MRAAHHADLLELELGRRRIPYVKYGGLKFLEAAHVKDLLAILRWAENPIDPIAGLSRRAARARRRAGVRAPRGRCDPRGAAVARPRSRSSSRRPPARDAWPALCELARRARRPATPWPGQLGRVRAFYEPLLVERYDAAEARLGDLAQLEAIAGTYPARARVPR